MEAETGPEAPPVFEEGKRADRCIYYMNGKFAFMKSSKWIGQFDTLEAAQKARDAYEAQNPPKPRGGNMRASKNGTAPVEATPPTPANGAQPSPPPEPNPQLRVGDVAMLKSGGELMTVVGVGANGIDLMVWSNGGLERLCLPPECVTKGS